MKVTNLSIFICPNCNRKKWKIQKFSNNKDEVKEGIIICGNCKIWYKIQNGILDLLPLALRRDDLYGSFAKKHTLTFTPQIKDSRAQKGKLSQITFFRETIEEYEQSVVNSKYYKALDHFLFWNWVKKNIDKKGVTLDLGCGTARQCIPLAKAKSKVIGMDITEEMLMLGKRKIKKAKVGNLVDLVVADCENPPVINNYFSACVIYGTLHHVPRPDKTLESASKKLKKGGLIYAMEPNKSPLRFLFEISMKLWKLWDEDRDEGELMSEEIFKKWAKKANLSPTISFSTYLPPHFFYHLKFDQRVKILGYIDKFLNKIPVIRTFGGLIIFDGKKTI